MSIELDRRKFIGSSDAAAAMGFSKYRTSYDVYLSKTEPEPGKMDPAMQRFLERRKRWEPVVVAMLREELDAEIVAINQRYVDPEVPYFAAEIDFEWRDTDGSIQNGEIKTVHPLAYGERQGWGEPGSGDVPVEYEAQVQFGLGVKRRERAILVAMVGIDKMEFYPIKMNGAVINEMRARLSEFWTRNVLGRVAPEPVNVEDVERMFRKANGSAIDAGADIGAKALRLRALAAQADALELEREALEFEVKNFMREHEELTVEGRKIATWKEANWSRLDTAALKEQERALYAKYLRTGKHRVFKALRST
jgi:predicted phage-related endonuclease